MTEKEKIPAISPGLHRRLYGEVIQEPDDAILYGQKIELRRQELDHLDPQGVPLELPLPYWLKPVDHAIKQVSDRVLKGFKSDLISLTGAGTAPNLTIPYVPGWRTYEKGQWKRCEPPCDVALVLDIETVNLNDETQPVHVVPVVCCAYAGPKMGETTGVWFIWWNDISGPETLVDVVPLGGFCTIVGHNVGYDRMHISTSYGPLDTNRFFDTRSAIIATRGLTNQQQAKYQESKMKRARRALDKTDETSSNPGGESFYQSGHLFEDVWSKEVTGSGLADSIQFYEPQWEIEKETRDGIWQGGLPYVQTNVAKVAKYCFYDITTTSRLLYHLLKPGEYYEHVPDLVTAGNILLAQERLPVNPKIRDFYTRVKTLHDNRIASVASEIYQIGLELADRWINISPEDYDPWEKQLAELPMGKSAKTKKWPEGKDLYGGDLLISGKNKGRPRWFTLIDTYSQSLTLSQRISVLVLKIKFRGKPLIYVKTTNEQGEPEEGWQAGGEWLVHPESRKKRVRFVSLKGYARHFERKVFTASSPNLDQAMLSARSTAISKQFLSRFQAIEAKNIGYGDFVIPCTTVMGAVSLRAQDSTFRVVKNPVPLTPENKALWKETGVIPPLPPSSPIGTSLLNHIEARPGWKFLSFDYAGQESRAAGLLANADTKGRVTKYAMDPFLRIQMVGSKQDKTDIHSRVAERILGDVTLRDYGKVLVYALLYNQGVKSAAEFLLSVLPEMDEPTAFKTAKKFQEEMKGYRDDYHGYSKGLASGVFNALAYYGDGLGDLSGSIPRSPLGSKISKGLWNHHNSFLTTRYNYVIQATCRCMLSIALLIFHEIACHYKIPHHLVFTIHDCVAYMIPETFIERAALALCIAHKYSWAKLEKTLNINTMSQIGLYPDEIEVDHIWRKKSSDPVATPEYPEGVPQLGYSITPAELLDRFHSSEGLDGCPTFKDDWLGNFDF